MLQRQISLMFRNTCGACLPFQPTIPNHARKVIATRMNDNPIFSPKQFHLGFSNCTGHSIIEKPSWIESAYNYLLFFTNEHGEVYVGFSSTIDGLYAIQPCVLRTNSEDALFYFPEVVVDEQQKQIILFLVTESKDEDSFLPEVYKRHTVIFGSRDGTIFKELITPFSFTYEHFKVFKYESNYFAIARDETNNCAVLLKSSSLLGNWEVGPSFLNGFRSGSFFVDSNNFNIWLFFTRVQEMPESILITKFPSNIDWKEWPNHMSEIESLLAPEEDYEGALAPHWFSTSGPASDEMNEVRYPHVFYQKETHQITLLYSVGGESGIAGATIRVLDEIDTLNTNA